MKFFANARYQFALLVALCCASTFVGAQQVVPGTTPQNSIDNMQVSQQQGVTIVKLTMKKTLSAAPASFSIASPARVAFDFADTENGLGRNAQQLNEGELRSVNIVQVGDRTRLVLNLNKTMTYETRIDGTNLYISLEPVQASSVAGAPQVLHFAADKQQGVSQSVRDISFRRGKDGEARVLVDLSDPNVGVDIQKQGVNLIVVFKKTTLPDNLNRRLDVADFATPVTMVNTQMQGENVQMTITPHGLWEHNAYQSDNQFVIEVRPVAENPNKLLQGNATQGEKLSLNFQNIDIRSVLQVIADFTNFNIITSDSVAGNVTLRLKDVPWDQALDIILQSKGLGMRKNGNVIWIAPDKEILERDEYQSKARLSSSQSEPMQTETFRLSFAKAEEVGKLVTGQLMTTRAASAVQAAAAGQPTPTPAPDSREKGSYISQSGSVTVDVRTNQMFVTDYPAYLERVRKLIAQVDQPVKQVLIEARVVSAEDSFGRSLGARLGYNDLSSTVPGLGVGTRVFGSNGTYGSVSGTYSGLFSQTGQYTGGAKGSGSAQSSVDATMVNLPAATLGGAAPSSIALSLFKSGLSSFINLELSAAETDGRVKAIASPRVITADGKQALISQGVDIPYTTFDDKGRSITAFRTAVLKLTVTPQITSDGTVILDLEVAQDTVGDIFRDGVSINTKNIKTRASVENGGTVVLGGIYEQIENDSTNQVPFLGDIPLVGNLFKRNTRTKFKKELLVFITPRIVDEQVQAMVR